MQCPAILGVKHLYFSRETKRLQGGFGKNKPGTPYPRGRRGGTGALYDTFSPEEEEKGSGDARKGEG